MLSMKPPVIFNQTPGHFPAVLVLTEPGKQNHYLTQSLTKWIGA